MGTNCYDIEAWFERGILENKAYMAVVCDTFDYDDYPIFLADKNEVEVFIKNPGEMQKVMEVYKLDPAMKSSQLNQARCWSI